jgi:SAM-dependent methyltransferase
MSLGVGELIFDANIYDAVNHFTNDVPLYQKWARKAGGTVLELCCGTGRITIPLAKAGLQITGLDFTDSMLERAKEKSASAGVQVEWIRGDMRQFNLGRTFSGILIPFNSLQNTYTLSDVEDVFRCIKNHLQPGGLFVFTVFNPSLEIIVDRSRNPVVWTRKLPDGRTLKVTESCRYDSAIQVNHVTWEHEWEGSPTTVVERLDMRCFYPLELDALLKYNGWRVVHKFGDFQEGPFTAESASQIYVCQLA